MPSSTDNKAGALAPVYFTVEGKAVPKGRPRATGRGGFVRMYTPKKTAEFESRVRTAAVEAMAGRNPLTGPLEVHVNIDIAPAPSWSKKARAKAIKESWHTHKPDADNVAKAVLDAMNGIVFTDDSQVALLRVVKIFAETHETHVFIQEL